MKKVISQKDQGIQKAWEEYLTGDAFQHAILTASATLSSSKPQKLTSTIPVLVQSDYPVNAGQDVYDSDNKDNKIILISYECTSTSDKGTLTLKDEEQENKWKSNPLLGIIRRACLNYTHQ